MLRREVLSVALGVMVAVAVVSAVMNLQAASMPAAPVEVLTAKNRAFETPQAWRQGTSQGAAYLPLVFSLLSAVLVYQVSSRLLTRGRLR